MADNVETGGRRPQCKLCGEPMPEGEEMFNYHGYSGPCPKSPTVTDFVHDEDCDCAGDSDENGPLEHGQECKNCTCQQAKLEILNTEALFRAWWEPQPKSEYYGRSCVKAAFDAGFREGKSWPLDEANHEFVPRPQPLKSEQELYMGIEYLQNLKKLAEIAEANTQPAALPAEGTPLHNVPDNSETLARWIWCHYVGIPITEPYDKEYTRLFDRIEALQRQWFTKGLTEAREQMHKLAAPSQPAQQWISVETKLPEIEDHMGVRESAIIWELYI